MQSDEGPAIPADTRTYSERWGCDVARRRNAGLVEQFALALAAGSTVADWCRGCGVPTSTAHGWRQAAPGFAGRVEAHRLALVARELDRMADRLTRSSRAEIGECPWRAITYVKF